eukprot:c17615_g1_i1 orf=758-967(-)
MSYSAMHLKIYFSSFKWSKTQDMGSRMEYLSDHISLNLVDIMLKWQKDIRKKWQKEPTTIRCADKMLLQ